MSLAAALAAKWLIAGNWHIAVGRQVGGLFGAVALARWAGVG